MPAIYMERARRFVQAAMSFSVWKITVARPVVPEEECIRIRSSREQARKP
jgi:hypothetical protein